MTEQHRPEEAPALPDTDQAHYEDTGCIMAPSCLRCHLPLCIYDDPRGTRGARQRDRDSEVARRYGEGWPVDALATHYRVSRRQVFRILRRLRVEEELEAEG